MFSDARLGLTGFRASVTIDIRAVHAFMSGNPKCVNVAYSRKDKDSLTLIQQDR